ncbi:MULTISPECIES: fumarylacetoacetate hydrolase family protein [unclassified Psychrobacillus]|uniref:fumarylacetoacetate hydrolase family protein n=1 Tax=unclassified Psychrobacillus TaxID=2636677 RepID=UPI00146E9729|nr:MULTISPECIES: fumarylacetoacetate hydrolase family protein [unclassified Psychrobacillus]MCM3358910.1 fumarylacetoacetate hydrolase family protein [Psychrobacillus sp. MER TA 171]NME07329.1 fumarylacetoacetate hydrolase family protein [Psychrobacillus sp. BL-248-WT-3]
MKLLSYRLNDKIYFGPKVKKEEAVWDVLTIQEELQVLPNFPATIVQGVSFGMDFIEQIRVLIETALKEEDPNRFKRSFTEIEWLSPIPRTPKNVMAIGKNYADHAKEMGGVAEDFVVFTKAPTTIAADEQTLPVHSEVTSSLDYEGELAIVIGKEGKNIPSKLAYDYVFGYTIANDITARDLQKKHQQFFLGKSLDWSCPMGPYVVTKDEIPNPQDLTIVTKVNDEIRQNGVTSDMIYSVENIICEISKIVTLEPGDVILTGTPAGVGKGFNPPKFLKSGDIVKVSIEGIGTLVNKFE